MINWFFNESLSINSFNISFSHSFELYHSPVVLLSLIRCLSSTYNYFFTYAWKTWNMKQEKYDKIHWICLCIFMPCSYDVPLNFKQCYSFNHTIWFSVHTHTRIVKINTTETMIKYSKHSSIFSNVFVLLFCMFAVKWKGCTHKIYFFFFFSEMNYIRSKEREKQF